MNHEDEMRIRRRRGLEEAEQKEVKEEVQISSIYDGTVMIHNVETDFVERQVGTLPCFLYMPNSFREMNEEEKAVLFARTKAPKHAFGCDDLLLFVSAAVTNKPLKNDQIRMFLDAGKRPLEAMIPQSKVYKSYIFEKNEKNVGCIEFVSGGIPSPLYNLMMFVSIEEELVILNIYTLNELKKTVFPYIEQMARSLRIEEKEE